MPNNNQAFANARNIITQHEGGVQPHVYTDTAGHPTIGIGFNLDRTGAQAAIESLGLNYAAVRNGTQTITNAQAQQLFDSDFQTAIRGARVDVSNFDNLAPAAQDVVLDMVYNLGATGFSKFVNLTTALENQDYPAAAAAMKDSTWYHQVGTRGANDFNLMNNASANPDPTPDPVPDPDPDPTPEPTPDPVPEPTPNPTPDPVPGPIPAPHGTGTTGVASTSVAWAPRSDYASVPPVAPPPPPLAGLGQQTIGALVRSPSLGIIGLVGLVTVGIVGVVALSGDEGNSRKNQ